MVSEVLSSADSVIEDAPVGVANWIKRNQQTAVAGKTHQPKAVVMGSLSNKQTDSLRNSELQTTSVQPPSKGSLHDDFDADPVLAGALSLSPKSQSVKKNANSTNSSALSAAVGSSDITKSSKIVLEIDISKTNVGTIVPSPETEKHIAELKSENTVHPSGVYDGVNSESFERDHRGRDSSEQKDREAASPTNQDRAKASGAAESDFDAQLSALMAEFNDDEFKSEASEK